VAPRRKTPTPRTLPDVVAQGDRRESLEAIREILALLLDQRGHTPGCECECGTGGDGRVVAQVSKELREVLRELDALPTAERVTPLDKLAGAVNDDLAQRRATRVADAAGT
jgi:hypothetical protein